MAVDKSEDEVWGAAIANYDVYLGECIFDDAHLSRSSDGCVEEGRTWWSWSVYVHLPVVWANVLAFFV